MPLRPMKDVGLRTERDAERERIMQEAHMHWAEVDRDIADALGELPEHYHLTIQRGGHDG